MKITESKPKEDTAGNPATSSLELVECNVCEATGLPERIDNHDCELFRNDLMRVTVLNRQQMVTLCGATLELNAHSTSLIDESKDHSEAVGLVLKRDFNQQVTLLSPKDIKNLQDALERVKQEINPQETEQISEGDNE